MDQEKIQEIKDMYLETFENQSFEDGFIYCLDKILDILED